MKGSHEDTKARRALFVLGSGVSSFACPSVTEITNRVLAPDKETLPDRFSRCGAEDELAALVGFLNTLSDFASRTTGAVTYEDLFSMCEHLQRWELPALPQDPAIRLFRNQILEETELYWEFYAQEDKAFLQELPLAAIALQAQILIHEVIEKVLIQETEHKNQLNLIAEAIDQLGSENVDILTLNHDCLVESLLDEREIPWTDGFDSEISGDADVVNFHTQAFENNKRVRIIKLHGGCDWHYAGTPTDGSQHNFRWVKVNVNKWIYDCIDHHGKQFHGQSTRAATLTGTTTKAESYTEGLHGELYLIARKVIDQHERIICSGYGWNDYAFNNMLREWATSQDWHQDTRREPKLLLLHDKDQLSKFETQQNLWFWPKNWKDNASQNWLRIHKHWLSNTRLSNISDLLFE
jgi:hypothetical protein